MYLLKHVLILLQFLPFKNLKICSTMRVVVIKFLRLIIISKFFKWMERKKNVKQINSFGCNPYAAHVVI